jgi:hypothetical protein
MLLLSLCPVPICAKIQIGDYMFVQIIKQVRIEML